MRELIRDLVRRDELCDKDLGCPGTEKAGEHGPDCPMLALDAEMASTGAGRVIQRALLLRRAAQSAKVRYSAGEVSYESLLTLGIVDEEEAAFMEEKSKRPHQD